MPGLDSTGPEGLGPRTGRQMGRCKPRPGSDDNGKNNESTNDEIEPGKGNYRVRGRGKGLGYGRRHGFGGGRGFGRGRGRGKD